MPHWMALVGKKLGRYAYSGILKFHRRFSLPSVEFARLALRRIRKDRNLSQVETAALLGSSVSAVQAWESGRRSPSGPVRRLITLTEHALKDWPPGPWREAVWGIPLAQIVGWRKHETEREQFEKARKDYEVRFLRSSLVEKEETIRAYQKLVNWMNPVAAKEREQARNKPGGKL